MWFSHCRIILLLFSYCIGNHIAISCFSYFTWHTSFAPCRILIFLIFLIEMWATSCTILHCKWLTRYIKHFLSTMYSVLKVRAHKWRGESNKFIEKHIRRQWGLNCSIGGIFFNHSSLMLLFSYISWTLKIKPFLHLL